MMSKLAVPLFAAFVGASGWGGAAAASGGADIRMEPAPVHRLDAESLQRGARTFVNYCLNCHSAKYMRYNRLTDLGIDIAMIEDNLMFASDKVGETMTVAMTAKDAKAWFGVPPPDLTVEARVRGADWLYNYFLGFYKDDASASGWNNLVFPNVGMPHVLWAQGGVNRLVSTEFKNHDEAQAAAIAAKGLAVLKPAKDHKFVVETLALDTPGTLTPAQYKAMIADLVNYMDYMAEPSKNKRISIGLIVLLYLAVLFVFVYWMKREYWKDVH
jgi:ubiquinol-cytochrome c reductase cytochrome c1 subunit